MNKKQKKRLIKIIIALILFVAILIPDKIMKNGWAGLIDSNLNWLLPFALYFLIFIFISHGLLKKAFLGIIHFQLLDENFLMTLASLGAFTLAIMKGIRGEKLEGFEEACAVVIFFSIGEWFEDYAVIKSRKSIQALMNIRPDYANLKIDDDYKEVSPEEVNVGDVILVKPGEKVPLDGVIINGSSALDTKAITGESIPKDVKPGDDIISGTINISSSIEIKVTKVFYDSTVTKILDMVENASSSKAKTENFITVFARVYTPIVVICALILAIFPTIITKDYETWIYRALAFLVVSCPCALVISIPLSFFGGIGAASANGILIKGSNYLELLNKANIFVFDKTGTLTKGEFNITRIYPEEKKDEILNLIAVAEWDSNHPIANSIKKIIKEKPAGGYTLENIAGFGIIATKNDDTIICGNAKLMENYNLCYNNIDEPGTVVYVAHNNEYLGYVIISDEIKDEATAVIAKLNTMGCRTIMLTGDNEAIASSIANKLNISEYRYELLPQDKAVDLDKLLEEKNKKDTLCFVGDGINDSIVLMKSDIGISMGSLGSDAAIEASDIVLMYDDLNGIFTAKKIAKKTNRIVFENIIFAIGVKLLILVLSAFGLANMWLALFGDVGVAVIAILNAMRAINIKKN